MKKIDKLVFKAFIGPFILTLAVVIFILLTQQMIRYFEDFIGKGLGFEVYAELCYYFSLTLTPMALPLAILIASLMTYGNLGEHFELTAIKSAGISMVRTLLPIFVFVLLLTYVGYLFNNIVVPYANLKAYSLLYDIRQQKPSLDLKEGGFYNGIPGYSIKVAKKYPDGKTLKGVIIYDHSEARGNTDVILADSGIMQTVLHDQYLELKLFNGNQYSEVANANNAPTNEFIKSKFDKTNIMFSLESFNMQRTDEELFKTNKIMLSVDKLKFAVDSIRKDRDTMITSLYPNLKPFFNFNLRDDRKFDTTITAKVPDYSKLTQEQKIRILGNAINNARNIANWTESFKSRIQTLSRDANDFDIERVRKYSQSIAIIIMFLIGAPLGAIIKKGGLGVPILVSVIFFIVYFVLMTLGQKYAKEGVLSVLNGIWMANYALLPFGLFFLKQARTDSRLFELDYFSVMWDRLKLKFK